MKSSARARRMERGHRRMKHATLPLVALVDIFTNVMIFLIINIGDVQVLDQDRNIHLPKSVAERRPEYTALIKIDGNTITLDGKLVAYIPAVAAAPSDDIVALHAALDEKLTAQPLTDEEKPTGRAVTIMGDKEIPYKILKRVMATCALAEFRDIALAVDRQEAPTMAPTALPTTVPAAGAAAQGV
jgi:biopolymer transport protein ExbD